MFCDQQHSGPTTYHLTCRSGRRGPAQEVAVLSIDASRDGVRVILVALASAKAGTSRKGSVATPGAGKNSGIPAISGENTSATKSTKKDGVRLRFSNSSSCVVCGIIYVDGNKWGWCCDVQI